MLSDNERSEIEELIKNYPQKRAACIEALKVIQKHRRWVSDESINDLSGLLEMTPDEVDSVATFYNLVFRKPVGRHVILICDSISCWVMGYTSVLQKITDVLGINLGETTPDQRFTLLTIPCLGTCDRAPALMIDNNLHRDLTVENIQDLLNKYE